MILAALAGTLAVAPARASAQVSVNIILGARMGPPVPVLAYAPERFGPWRDDYPRWTPVVLYEVDGRYYRHRARDARAIEVYVYGGNYFLPPRDAGWVGYDRRYDYRLRPGREHDDEDRGRGRGRGRGHGDDRGGDDGGHR
ncbi:MAG: hypothetical protein ACYCVL_12785 [Gemmatimonadaceae bacterium]